MIEPDNRLNICNRPTCKRPPEGWYCTRPAGHDGPCAAYPKNMNDRKPEPGEWPIANTREQLEALAGLKLPEAEKKQQESLPTATELLSRQAWSLKCLLQDIRSTSKVLYGEQRANATLAVRHLEDALHRIKLALEP